MQASPTLLATLVLVAMLVASPFANARSHKSTVGRCTVRSSAVDSRSVAASTAAGRGISRVDDVAIVDVTVGCAGRPGNGTVRADIVVTRADLAGTKETVGMQMDRQNGYVSYYGTYPSVPGSIVRLVISATPDGMSGPLTLTYRHPFPDR